jgi:tRNA nucleotidyltransferase/poly(A) polymerase
MEDNILVNLAKKGLEFANLLPSELLIIIETLQRHDKDALIIGGAIRDFLFGSEIGDFDVATDAVPEEIKKWMNAVNVKTKFIGGEFGTVLAIVGKSAFDVSTYRTETFEVHGQPPTVAFVNSLTADLARRDFRLNAIVYNPQDKMISDPHCGINDIRNKTIHMIGDPEIRLKEDGLRIIRLARFMAKFDLTPDHFILSAVHSIGKNAKFRNKRAMRIEFLKLIQVSNPSKGLNLLYQNESLKAILPQFPFSIYSTDEIIKRFSLVTVDNEITRLFGFLILMTDDSQLNESHFKQVSFDLELSFKQEQQLQRLYTSWKNFPLNFDLQMIKRWVRATGINASEVLVHIYFLKLEKEKKHLDKDRRDQYLKLVRKFVKKLKTG